MVGTKFAKVTRALDVFEITFEVDDVTTKIALKEKAVQADTIGGGLNWSGVLGQGGNNEDRELFVSI